MFTSFARLLAMEFQKLGEGFYLNSFNQPFYPEHIFSTQLSQKGLGALAIANNENKQLFYKDFLWFVRNGGLCSHSAKRAYEPDAD